MSEIQNQILVDEFERTYRRTNNHKKAIFQERGPLLEQVWSTGNPIYCNRSYYVHEKVLYRVTKVGDHFECDDIKDLTNWRDCHYYTECQDAKGNKVWLMHGGRYD